MQKKKTVKFVVNLSDLLLTKVQGQGGIFEGAIP